MSFPREILTGKSPRMTNDCYAFMNQHGEMSHRFLKTAKQSV